MASAQNAVNRASIIPPAGIVDEGCTGTPQVCKDDSNNNATDDDPIVSVSTEKIASPASGQAIAKGSVIEYTLSVTVTGGPLPAPVVLTDTVSDGQTLDALPAGCASTAGSGGATSVTCTLPEGTAARTTPYTFVYSTTVALDAVSSVSNSVTASIGTCASCATTHPLLGQALVKELVKINDADAGGIDTVSLGDTLTYKVTLTNTSASGDLTDVVVSDPLITPDSKSCERVAPNETCVLEGTYTVKEGDAIASKISNIAVVTSSMCAPDSTDPACTVTHDVVVDQQAKPEIKAVKTAVLTVDQGAPGVGDVGDVITYSVTVMNTGNITVENLVVEDSFNGGAPVVMACAPTTLGAGQSATCDDYQYTIKDADVEVEGGLLRNQITASAVPLLGPKVTSDAEAVIDVRATPATVRIVKTATPRDIHIGDLVRYTLVMENTSSIDVVDGTLVDTPPAGFNYVDVSLTVADDDNAGRLVGTYPIRVDQIDIAAGERATITYLLRVGAGVRTGIHTNSALLQAKGETVSNVATADVQLVGDPLLDESLILGTVFDDRDGDGWQDSAAMDGVRVQGGFSPGVYVADSTTVDHGDGPERVADASSPLLHGIAIGTIGGRQSDADPVKARQVIVSQILSSPTFANDFVLTTKQGVILRMDADGDTRIERAQGEAAKGLSAAEPTVKRIVSRVERGYRVDYVIGNAGVDERGIPGVRIASVEGLLVETDQFGRYHLLGVEGGSWERGRNFILKVDPATVPPGSELTTDNPLLRRVTPGLPVRFDFGVKLPQGLIESGTQNVEIELGEVVFQAASAKLQDKYLPVIDAMAAQVIAYGAGDVVISANGESRGLAYERAKRVREALLAKLPEALQPAVTVSLRTVLEDPHSTLLSLGESPLLGTVLFDTDQAVIRPEFQEVIAKIAADIEQSGGGVVSVIGHADRRGSLAYNDALGLRRAKVVFNAIAARLGPQARGLLRVEISDHPVAPAGIRGQ